MFLRIEENKPKKLIGQRRKMSIAKNETFQLFSNFMPQLKHIAHRKNNEIICLQIYPEGFNYLHFDPNVEFDKWAAVEISESSNLLPDMEFLVVPEGNYAVFLHKGPASEFQKTYNYICNEWFPQSKYLPDNRPYFEVMGEKYKNNDVSSEEEIWIPIKHISQVETT